MTHYCRTRYQYCSKGRPCFVCKTPKSALSRTPPNFRAEVKRALQRPDDIAFIRSFGQCGVPYSPFMTSGQYLHDFRVSVRWAVPVTPVPDMTPAQREAELNRQLKRLRRGDAA